MIPPLRRSSPEDAPPLPVRQKPCERELPSPTTTCTLSEETPHSISALLANYCPAPVSVNTPTDRLLELRLLSHYQEMISRSSKPQASWSIWNLDMAMKSPLVMDSLLGFTAFHLRRLGNRDWGVREASHRYMARAIRSHKEESRVGLSDANAASLISSCAFILFHTSTNQEYLHSVAGPQLPLHWFRPWQSAKGFFGLMWPWFQTIEVGRDMGLRFGLQYYVSMENVSDKFDFLLQDMEPECMLDQEMMTAYRQAVWQLACIHGNPEHRKVLRFPALVTPRFVELLEAQDPRTLAIVGYFFMLVKLATALWWVDGAAEREFAAVMEFLPKDWWPVMDWAVRVFGSTSNRVSVAQKELAFGDISDTEYPDWRAHQISQARS
ncbi:Protein RTM1 [Ilyonectria robusta]